MKNTKKKFLLPHEKLGMSEFAFLIAYEKGYRSIRGIRCPYPSGTPAYKAYQKGKRDK